jgi:hypothetical protein
MSKWIIESNAGVFYGTYEGASEKDAFMAMLDESGDVSAYGEAHVGTEADWIIKPADLVRDDPGKMNALFEVPASVAALAHGTN